MAPETSAVQSTLVFAGIAVLLLAFGVATDPPPTRPIDFNRDVRPILSDRCFGCHGPDAAKRKAGLRLDTPEGAFAVPDGGLPAIAPGNLWGSEAVHRIDSDDPDEVMPPPSLKRPLSDSERAILRRWIEEGAEYRPHWAFVPPASAPLPEAPAADEPPANGAASWPRDPIDAFVLAGLRAAGLTPAPDADRATLLRRVTLVLTGLPPTPEEVDGFVADTAADAYERRVDALLASPRAAEHMATTWLDLARFADTYGYQSDAECFTWPWRDWLLRALASNMPYDRFVTALVAGDLVPNATLDDRVATAFNRLHRMTEEGGSIAEEFRQEGIADRVSTFGTTFLGLTLECARCHDHKYDPVPTSEFYGLAAMFGRIDENGLKSFAHPANVPPPVVRLLTPEQDRRAEILRAAVRAARASVDGKARAVAAAFDPRGERPLPPLPPPIARYPFETLDNGTTPNSIAGGAPASTDRQRPEQLGSIALAEGHAEPDGKAIAFDGDGGLLLPGLPPFTRHDPITIACWIRLGEVNRRATLLHSSGFYTNDADASGLELLIAEGRLRWSVIQLWPGSAISLETTTPLTAERWHHLVVTYDGLGRADGLAIYLDGVRAATRVVRDALDGPIATSPLEVGSRSRDAGFRGGRIDDLTIWRSALSPVAVAELVGRTPTSDERRVAAVMSETAEASDALRAALIALAAHLDPLPAMMCMADSPFAQPSYVLERGAYDRPDPQRPTPPGALAAVLPYDFGGRADRLALATWLVDPRHPLTARVEINRLWAQVFGSGLVETNENFGVQGAWPSHPEVLDRLAHDFTHGPHAWDRRSILRRLVLSATFRQSSVTTAEKRDRDPNNALLSRGPSVRLSAEMLRDAALHASGLLVESFGGPSVKPYQQPELVAASGANGSYVADSGPNAHRRSLYTFRKRTVPPPTMQTFDGGSREACQPRRSATNTPMQSLAILNDPIFTECAKALADRAMAEASERDARIERAFRLACARAPRIAELDALRTLVETQSAAFAAEPAQAKLLVGAEDPERAAMTLACSAILANDGFLVIR